MPTGAPPPVAVLFEVPVDPGLVAVVAGGCVAVVCCVVGGGVAVVVVVVVVTVWVWVVVVVEVTVGVVDEVCGRQSVAASWATVTAPWPRLRTSFGSTFDGSREITCASRRDAAAERPQRWALTADEIASSLLAIALL